jgi:hypothetical protein
LYTVEEIFFKITIGELSGIEELLLSNYIIELLLELKIYHQGDTA